MPRAKPRCRWIPRRMNPADATIVMTSFWQNNLIGLRAERFINWKRARTGSVQWLDQTYVA